MAKVNNMVHYNMVHNNLVHNNLAKTNLAKTNLAKIIINILANIDYKLLNIL